MALREPLTCGDAGAGGPHCCCCCVIGYWLLSAPFYASKLHFSPAPAPVPLLAGAPSVPAVCPRQGNARSLLCLALAYVRAVYSVSRLRCARSVLVLFPCPCCCRVLAAPFLLHAPQHARMGLKPLCPFIGSHLKQS